MEFNGNEHMADGMRRRESRNGRGPTTDEKKQIPGIRHSKNVININCNGSNYRYLGTLFEDIFGAALLDSVQDSIGARMFVMMLWFQETDVWITHSSHYIKTLSAHRHHDIRSQLISSCITPTHEKTKKKKNDCPALMQIANHQIIQKHNKKKTTF